MVSERARPANGAFCRRRISTKPFQASSGIQSGMTVLAAPVPFGGSLWWFNGGSWWFGSGNREGSPSEMGRGGVRKSGGVGVSISEGVRIPRGSGNREGFARGCTSKRLDCPCRTRRVRWPPVTSRCKASRTAVSPREHIFASVGIEGHASPDSLAKSAIATSTSLSLPFGKCACQAALISAMLMRCCPERRSPRCRSRADGDGHPRGVP